MEISGPILQIQAKGRHCSLVPVSWNSLRHRAEGPGCPIHSWAVAGEFIEVLCQVAPCVIKVEINQGWGAHQTLPVLTPWIHSDKDLQSHLNLSPLTECPRSSWDAPTGLGDNSQGELLPGPLPPLPSGPSQEVSSWASSALLSHPEGTKNSPAKVEQLLCSPKPPPLGTWLWFTTIPLYHDQCSPKPSKYAVSDGSHFYVQTQFHVFVLFCFLPSFLLDCKISGQCDHLFFRHHSKSSWEIGCYKLQCL